MNSCRIVRRIAQTIRRSACCAETIQRIFFEISPQLPAGAISCEAIEAERIAYAQTKPSTPGKGPWPPARELCSAPMRLDYSAASPREAIQSSTSLTRQRVAFGPIFRGAGKSPAAFQRQTVATLTPSIVATRLTGIRMVCGLDMAALQPHQLNQGPASPGRFAMKLTNFPSDRPGRKGEVSSVRHLLLHLGQGASQQAGFRAPNAAEVPTSPTVPLVECGSHEDIAARRRSGQGGRYAWR